MHALLVLRVPVLLYATPKSSLCRPLSTRLRSPAGTCAALQTHPTTLSNAAPEWQAKKHGFVPPQLAVITPSSRTARGNVSASTSCASEHQGRDQCWWSRLKQKEGGSAHQWHVDVIILAVAECAHGPEAPGEERIVLRHEQAVRVARVDVASTGEVRRHRVTLDRLDRVAVLPRRRAGS